MKRDFLYLAYGWCALCSILSPAVLLGSAGDGAPGSLITRVTLGAESQRPAAITFDARGDLAIVMAPFGDLSTRDGTTLMPRRGVMHLAGAPPISPVSLVAAPDGTLYAAGYMQQVARSHLGRDGHSGPMGPWLRRAELGSVAPIGLAVDSSGDLFAADMADGLAGNQRVVRIDRETGAVEMLVPAGAGGLQSARALAFDALDRLYVADPRAGAVVRFTRGTGELDRAVVLPSRDRGSEFVDLEIGPGGQLYVLDSARGEVMRFNLDIPGSREVLIDLSEETVERAIGMAVSSSGDVVVLTGGSELLLYAGDGPGPGPAPTRAPPVTTSRPAAGTSRSLHLRAELPGGARVRQADWGILLREIYRQGFALAAIDHVGALVRDQALGESAPAGALELVASVLVLPGQTLRLGLADPAAPSVPRWSQDLPVGDGKRVDYLDAVAEVERLARERWPDVLRSLGLERFADQPGRDGAAEPAQPPTASDELDVLTQLARVRSAHRRLEIAEEEALEELALGYANLGFLTAFQWSSASESLKARSLLYAERLATGRPTPRALRARAYARALAGFHSAALGDLESVDSAPSTAGWQEVIEAYCRSDFRRLTRLATEVGASSDLAGRLAFQLAADSGSPVLVRRAAEAVLVGNPRAWEVDARMGLSEDFGVLAAGSTALERNLEDLGVRLSSTPGLPTSSPPPDDDPSALTEMLESLRLWWSKAVASEPGATPSVAVEMTRQLESLSEAAAGDDGQPSWQSLAHLLGETLFAQIERLVGFERFKRSVDVGGLLEQLRPLWRDNPLAGLVESYGVDPRLDPELFHSLISDLEVAQPRPELEYLRRQLELAGDSAPTATMWSELGLERSALDETAGDLRILLDHAYNAGVARRLLEVSPDSPAALAALIRWDWPAVAERAREWMAEPAHPLISRALADRYRRVQQPEEALEVLQRYVAEIPDAWAYGELASIHSEMGNADEWRRAQEEFLVTTDEQGLAHSRAREQLAPLASSSRSTTTSAGSSPRPGPMPTGRRGPARCGRSRPPPGPMRGWATGSGPSDCARRSRSATRAPASPGTSGAAGPGTGTSTRRGGWPRAPWPNAERSAAAAESRSGSSCCWRTSWRRRSGSSAPSSSAAETLWRACTSHSRSSISAGRRPATCWSR